MQTAGIIGGSGFIGSYITKIFLEEGYQVRVSSTDLTNQRKYIHLQDLPVAGNLEVCALDLMNERSVCVFLKGCDFVIHAGTPYKLDVSDPFNQLIRPTVSGTQRLLEALQVVGGIRKVVFLGSVAAWNTSFPLSPPNYPLSHVFTEKDPQYWREHDHPYARAQFMADQVVRQYILQHPQLPFGITTLSPVMVIGNSLSSRGDSTSVSLQERIRNRRMTDPFIEMLFSTDLFFSMVDVRDVAEAVYQATVKTVVHGRNYLVANESYRVSDISRMLNDEEPLNKPEYFYSSDLAKKELGLAFIPARETLRSWVREGV